MLGDDILGLMGDGGRRGNLGLVLGDLCADSRGEEGRRNGDVGRWMGDEMVCVGDDEPLRVDGEGIRMGVDTECDLMTRIGVVGESANASNMECPSPEKIFLPGDIERKGLVLRVSPLVPQGTITLGPTRGEGMGLALGVPGVNVSELVVERRVYELDDADVEVVVMTTPSGSSYCSAYSLSKLSERDSPGSPSGRINPAAMSSSRKESIEAMGASRRGDRRFVFSFFGCRSRKSDEDSSDSDLSSAAIYRSENHQSMT